MTKDSIRADIESFIAGTAQYLVDIKLSPGKLAVYIDKQEGITLEECISLNKHLIELWEPTGFLEKHEIEISSPGMDMPFKIYKQYIRRIGKPIRVIDHEGKIFSGLLESANDSTFTILSVSEKKGKGKKETTEELKNFSYENIKEARLNLNLKF